VRLKTFTAGSVSEAIELMQREMGAEAIVISTREPDGEQAARVTTAVEADPMVDLGPEEAQAWSASEVLDTVRQTLTFHGVPERPTGRLLAAAEDAGADEPLAAIASALDTAFAFAALPNATGRGPLMLVGLPGCGKTVATAKLAARASMAGRAVRVISTDTRRAGGIEQLAAFTRILGLDLVTAGEPAELVQALAEREAEELVYIDTPAVNPYNAREVDGLRRLIAAAEAEPLLVLAAGGDALEAADHARRLGSLFAAADAALLEFAAVSATPNVANGLNRIDPAAMARLLLPDPPGTSHRASENGTSDLSEAAS